MLNLRVGEYLVDRVDASARHSGLVQAVDPGRAGRACEAIFDLDRERIAILGSQSGSNESGVVDQVRAADGSAQPLPHGVSAGADVDVPVGSSEYSCRNVSRVVIARLL